MPAAIEYGTKAILVVKRDGQAAQHGLRRRQPALLITGEIDGNVMPEFRKRARQCADNIGKAARLRERDSLRGGKDDVHSRAPSQKNTEAESAVYKAQPRGST